MPFLPKPVIQTPNNTETIEKMTSFSSVTNQGRPYEQLLHNISGNSTVSWSISNHHSTKHPAEPAVTEIFQLVSDSSHTDWSRSTLHGR